MNATGNNINMGRIKLFTILGLLFGMVLIIFGFKDKIAQPKSNNLSYSIENRWELPFDLREISGIAWLEDGKIAAVQDEDGIIFIYDLKMNQVEKEINFGQPGDYEGIAVNGTDAYVMRSDGAILAIHNFEDSDRTVKIYKTPFTDENNMETLELDVDRNSLLISPKDRDSSSDSFKGVYAFSLVTKEMATEPIIKINMTDEALERLKENDLYKTFRPSDLAIHPKTKEIYLLEGAKPKLLILDVNGSLKNAYGFDRKLFPQPEGITFSPDGTLYISSEGENDGKGTITELKLWDKK